MPSRSRVSRRNPSSSSRTTSRRKAAARSGAAAPKRYTKLKFDTPAALKRSLGGVRIKAESLHLTIAAEHERSAARSMKLARAAIAKPKKDAETHEVMRGLMGWASAGTTDAAARRAKVCRAYRAEKQGIIIMQGISQLSREEAAAFMKSWFRSGGTMKEVGQWLAIAGNVIDTRDNFANTRVRGVRRARLARARGWGLLGSIGSAISGAASAAGNALSGAASTVGNAVSTVVDAVVSAGKSVADAVAAAASWTAAQVSDLVRALLNAGKTVAVILSAALAKSLVGKFVRAVLDAGRALADVLAWTAQQAANTVAEALRAIVAAGRTVFDVLTWSANQATSVAQTILRAAMTIGRTVAQLMIDLVRLTATALRRMVGVLYNLVNDVAQILLAAAQCALSIIRTVVEGLIAVGVSLVKLVFTVCTNILAGFRRGFFEGLKAIGYGFVDICKAALASSLAVLALAFAVVMELCGGHRGLTAAERVEARRVFGSSIDLDRVKIAVASIPSDFINWINGQRTFTTMYVINFSSWGGVDMRTLMHEMTHVWQAAVAGPIYMVEALHSQFFGRGYNVTDADLANANGDFNKLEREQQATVVERYWAGRWGGSGDDWAKYQTLAQAVFTPIPRSLRPLPATIGLPIRRRFVQPRAILLTDDA